MPKFTDLFPYILQGATDEVQRQRTQRQEMAKEQRTQQHAIDLLRAKAQIERETNPPLDPMKAIEMLKGSGMVPQGMTVSADGKPTFRFGIPKPAPGAAKADAAVKQAQTSKAQLQEIFKTAETALPAIKDTIPGVPEGVEAIGKGGLRWLGARSGFNEPARAFLDTQVADARQVIRGLGEVGVLTDKDVADASKLLPQSSDSVTVRQQKLASLNRLIDAKIGVYQTKSVPVESDTGDDAAFIQQLEAQGYTVEPAS